MASVNTIQGTHEAAEDRGNIKWVVVNQADERNVGNWKRQENAVVPDSHILELHVYVKENQAILEQVLHEVSDPKSVNYGKTISKKDIADIAMLPGDKTVVMNWVHSLPNQSHVHLREKERDLGSHIEVAAPVGTWNQALNTKFYYYQEEGSSTIGKTSEPLVRCEQYSLPDTVATSISAIHHTTDFPINLNPGPVRASPASSESVSGTGSVRDSIRINPGLKNLAAGGTREDVHDKRKTQK